MPSCQATKATCLVQSYLCVHFRTTKAVSMFVSHECHDERNFAFLHFSTIADTEWLVGSGSRYLLIVAAKPKPEAEPSRP